MIEQQTRRQQELTALETQRDEIEQEVRATQAKARTVQAEIDQRRTACTALETELEAASLAGNGAEIGRVRAKRAGLRGEIEDRQHALGVLNRRLTELGQHPVYRAWPDAQRALLREPCEMALQGVDEAMRHLEAAWSIATAEADLLAQVGDDWGRDRLYRLRGDFTPGYVAYDGGLSLRLPHVPAD